MASQQFTVREIVQETPRAILLRLEAGLGPFSFTAGQAAMLGLADRAGRRPYSIASSPQAYRRCGILEFLVEVGPDGQAGPHLEGVAPGSRVAADGPVGGFVLPRRVRRDLLFLAGGTGIAPLRSMIGSALSRGDAPHATLVYSARTPDEFAFGRELRQLSRRGKLQLCMTVTREAGRTWRGRRGRIRQAWVDAFVKDRAPLCFVCGPESFVAGVTVMLGAAGVPGRDIRREQY